MIISARNATIKGTDSGKGEYQDSKEETLNSLKEQEEDEKRTNIFR